MSACATSILVLLPDARVPNREWAAREHHPSGADRQNDHYPPDSVCLPRLAEDSVSSVNSDQSFLLSDSGPSTTNVAGIALVNTLVWPSSTYPNQSFLDCSVILTEHDRMSQNGAWRGQEVSQMTRTAPPPRPSGSPPQPWSPSPCRRAAPLGLRHCAPLPRVGQARGRPCQRPADRSRSAPARPPAPPTSARSSPASCPPSSTPAGPAARAPVTWTIDTGSLTADESAEEIANLTWAFDPVVAGQRPGLHVRRDRRSSPTATPPSPSPPPTAPAILQRHIYLAFVADASSDRLGGQTVGLGSPSQVFTDDKEIVTGTAIFRTDHVQRASAPRGPQPVPARARARARPGPRGRRGQHHVPGRLRPSRARRRRRRRACAPWPSRAPRPP